MRNEKLTRLDSLVLAETERDTLLVLQDGFGRAVGTGRQPQSDRMSLRFAILSAVDEIADHLGDHFEFLPQFSVL